MLLQGKEMTMNYECILLLINPLEGKDYYRKLEELSHAYIPIILNKKCVEVFMYSVAMRGGNIPVIYNFACS